MMIILRSARMFVSIIAIVWPCLRMPSLLWMEALMWTIVVMMLLNLAATSTAMEGSLARVARGWLATVDAGAQRLIATVKVLLTGDVKLAVVAQC